MVQRQLCEKVPDQTKGSSVEQTEAEDKLLWLFGTCSFNPFQEEKMTQGRKFKLLPPL